MKFPAPTKIIDTRNAFVLLKKDRWGYSDYESLLVFEARDFKDRIYLVMALRKDKELVYLKSVSRFKEDVPKIIPKNIFKVFLYHYRNDWLYVSPKAEGLLYADLLIEVI